MNTNILPKYRFVDDKIKNKESQNCFSGDSPGHDVGKMHGHSKLIVNVDSTVVTTYLKMHSLPWNLKHKIQLIKQHMESMEACIIEHCYRETNTLADEIASIGASERFVEMDVENL